MILPSSAPTSSTIKRAKYRRSVSGTGTHRDAFSAADYLLGMLRGDWVHPALERVEHEWFRLPANNFRTSSFTQSYGSQLTNQLFMRGRIVIY